MSEIQIRMVPNTQCKELLSSARRKIQQAEVDFIESLHMLYKPNTVVKFTSGLPSGRILTGTVFELPDSEDCVEGYVGVHAKGEDDYVWDFRVHFNDILEYEP